MRSFIQGLLLLSLLSSTGCGVSPSATDQPAVQSSQQIRLVLLTIGSDTHPFWRAVEDAAEAAATSLGVGLSARYLADADELHSFLDEMLAKEQVPDGIIFTGTAELSLELLPRAESAGVATLLINAGLPEDRVDDASDKFSYWLGQITPPDAEVGYLVAAQLIQSVQKDAKGDDDAVKIIALTGGESDKAAVERNQGLRRAVQEYPQTELLTLMNTNWSADDAAQQLRVALAEYPQANAVWTASGLMIPGILPVMAKSGRPTGESMRVATVGWTQVGLQAVSEGKVHADVGGHFLEGAWAAVALHDHLKGRGQADTMVMHSTAGVISAANVATYKQAAQERVWHQVDFSSFSRRQDSEREGYAFSIESVFGVAQ